MIKWPKWYKALSILFCLGFFAYHFESSEDSLDVKFDKDILININGIVVEKYIDNQNHLYETCVFKRDTNSQKFIFNLDDSGFFEYVEIGDSIYKKKGDSLFQVFRGSNIENFVLKY
ncbi:hypothetical protein N9242_00345 [Vicingaceae bacterium]|nr:hypothetical protein [Vicingaceae bacterium]